MIANVNRLVLQITYWPTDDENNVQTQDVVLSDVQLCRPIDSNSVYRRRRAISSPVTNRIVDLKPYKSYSATVSVLNLGQTSDASDPVTFMTLQHSVYFGLNLICLTRHESVLMATIIQVIIVGKQVKFCTDIINKILH